MPEDPNAVRITNLCSSGATDFMASNALCTRLISACPICTESTYTIRGQGTGGPDDGIISFSPWILLFSGGLSGSPARRKFGQNDEMEPRIRSIAGGRKTVGTVDDGH